MTDEQIVKALECCGKMKEYKKECPLGDVGGIDKCIHTLMLDALDLIKRQQAEIEKTADYKKLYEELKTEHLEMIRGIKNCRAKAIREFASKVERKCIESGIYPVCVRRALERTLDETTEKEGGITVGTKVVVTNVIDRKYNGIVVNVSDFREPNMKYAVDIGLEDVVFVGDKSIQPTEKEGADNA